MVKEVVRRIGVVSLAVISALIYAVFGLIYGIIFALVGVAIPGMPEVFGPIVIIMGIIGGAFAGFVFGAIFAILYNIATRFVKGVEIDLEKST